MYFLSYFLTLYIIDEESSGISVLVTDSSFNAATAADGNDEVENDDDVNQQIQAYTNIYSPRRRF